MVLEGIASSILSHFLSKYIYKLDTKDIKMSIFSGKVALDNLVIKETALMEHQIPFRVEKGTVKSISASIPYTKLKTSPCQAAIDEIFVLGTLAGKVLIQADSNTNNSKDIPEEYSTLDEALQSENISKTDFTTGVIGSIIDNIRVSVSNIHIRLEYKSENRTVAVGIIIPLVKVCTIDETGKEVDVNPSKTKIQKKLILSNLSIYVDTNCEQITEKVRNKTVDFQKEMINLQNADHQYILHNCSFEVLYEHFKAGNGPIQFGNILRISTMPINLSIDMLQYRCFNQLHNENIKFNRKRFYASCGRPDEFPEDDGRRNECVMWWQFLTRSAYKKNHPFNFNPQKALIFLKKRQKQLNTLSQILTNPNPKKDEKYLLKLQEKYGGDVFLMFRAYAKMITEKKLREEKLKKTSKIELQSNELQEIISQKDFIKNNSDTLAVQFKIEEINVLLSFTDKKPLLLLQWKSWRGIIEKNKSDISIDAEIGDLLLINKKSANLPNIITMSQNKASKNNSVLLHINGNLLKKLFDTKISMASPQFYLDMPMIYDISHFFGSTSDISREEKVPKIKKRDMTDLEIESLFDKHITLLLHLHLETPIAKIPYKQPFTISVGNIDIKSIDPSRKIKLTDVDSWYDKYSIDIIGFNVFMENAMICEPINFNLNLNQTFVRRNSVPMLKFSAKISSIEFNLNRDQYCLLLQFPEFLQNEALNATQINDLISAPDNKNNKSNNSYPSQSFNLDDLNLSFLFNLLFDQVSLNLINTENEKCCDTIIRGIKCGIKAIQSTIISNFNLQNLIIQSKDSEIVSFGDSQEDAIKANLLMKGRDINTTLQTARPIITVNIDWIMELFNFFNPPQELFKYRDSKIQSGMSVLSSYFNSVAFSILSPTKELNDYQITRILNNHFNLKLDINCTAPKLILPIRNSAFTANLGSIHIYTKDPLKREISNKDSFYDRFMIELDNFEILGDDNEHLLNPFSTSIEIDKSFVSLRSIKEIKVLVSIHDLNLQIKQRHFQSIIMIVDQFLSLYFTMNEKINTKSLETITNYSSDELIDANKSSSTHLYGFEQMFLNSDNLLSVLVDLKFENLQISLLKEDRSIHSSFVMNQLQSTIDISNNNIDADFKIVKLTASSENQVIVSFGKENVDSFNCKLNIINKQQITADFTVSEPTVNLDFNKILHLFKFIEIPLISLLFFINNIEGKIDRQKIKKKLIAPADESTLKKALNLTKGKNKLNITGKFNKIKVKAPVLYEKSNETLEIEINCGLKINEAIRIEISSLTARFNDKNGLPHPPFIPNLSIMLALESNVIAISTNPSQSLIAVALDDIASIGVFITSLLKFVNSIKSSQISQNEMKKDKIVDKSVDINQFTLSTEINKLQFQLNSDRFQTVPLFRFCMKQLNFIYTVDRLSRSNCQFDSIDFMDMNSFSWKMLVEPFSADIELFHKISEETDENGIQLNVSVSDPININFAYSAVQMILKYSNLVLKMMSSKEELRNEQPFFKVQNVSSESIIVKDKDQKMLSKINPNSSHDLKLTKDDEINITIGDISKKIITSQLHYPIFFTKRSVISHNMSEKGTTLLVSSVLLFENQTEYPLYLLKQEGLRRYSNVMDISSNEKKPMINLDELKSSQFALTTEKTLLNRSHNTFTLKTIKKKAILLDCIFPDESIITLVVSCKFDPLSCSMIVKIEPNCMIQNQLPVGLIIKLPDGSILRIKEGEKLKTTSIDSTQGEIEGQFSAVAFSSVPIDPVFISQNAIVSMKNGSFSPIELTFIYDELQSPQVSQITAKTVTNPNKPQVNLIFYSPALIYNRSGFNLGCCYLEKGQINRVSRFFPREKGCNPFDDGFALWSSKEYFLKNDQKGLPLVLLVTGKDERTFVDDDTIECSVAHIDGPIMIPTLNPNLFYPLHFTIASAEPYSASKLVTITAQCRISNMTKKSFFIQPVIPIDQNDTNDKNDTNENWTFGDSVEVKSGSEMEKIEIASMSLLFAFRIDKDSKNYSILNFSEPIHTTFAVDGEIFEIETQALRVEMLITVKEAVFPQPLNLLNDLEIEGDEIFITQTSSSVQSLTKDKLWKSKANPQTMTVVAYDMPFGGTDITLHYQDEEIPINLIAVNSPCKCRDIYYEVITNQNNTKTIVVSRKPWKLVELKTKLDFSFNITKINFVIIDKFDHEFCLIRLQDLSFSYSTGEFNSMQFKLRTLQLDDLQPSSVLKVVAACYPEEEKDKDGNPNYFIDFSISMFPNAPFLTACQDISLKVEPIVVFLDISFLTDTISLFQTMFDIEHSNDSFLLSKPKPSEPSSLNSIPLTAKSLTISEINITLFVRSTSSRPILYKTSFSFLKAIPDITNGQIDLPSFHFEDCTMNAAYIEKEIVKPIINAGIAQGLKLLFNTDIFMRSTGTRSASFARKGERLMNGELQVLIQVPGSIILQGGETFANFFSKVAHMTAFDNKSSINRVNTTAKDTMVSGMKALGNGFKDGITGIITQPMKMGEERGVGGAIVGFGKGMIGLVAKPVAGFLDAGVASFAAVRKKINGEDDDVIPPIRCARALPMIQLNYFSDNIMKIKDLAQLQFQLSDIESLYNQWVEMYVNDPQAKILVGVTQNYLFMADENGSMMNTYKIKKIVDVQFDKNKSIIKIVVWQSIRNKEINIFVKNPYLGFRITQLINSRRIPLGIGE